MRRIANPVFSGTLVQIIAIQLLSIFCLNSCQNKPEEINKFSAKDLAKEKADSVKINYTVGGKAKAHLTAPLMYRVQDTMPYVEFPNTMHVDFYNGDTIITSKLDAHYAKYYENKSLVYLKDSVRIINIEKGDTLYTDELYWDRFKTNTEFYTEKPVKIRTRTQLIDGIGMESKQDFKDWHIKVVTGIIKVPNSQFPD